MTIGPALEFVKCKAKFNNMYQTTCSINSPLDNRVIYDELFDLQDSLPQNKLVCDFNAHRTFCGYLQVDGRDSNLALNYSSAMRMDDNTVTSEIS